MLKGHIEYSMCRIIPIAVEREPEEPEEEEEVAR
jgi:hypothetical protein